MKWRITLDFDAWEQRKYNIEFIIQAHKSQHPVVLPYDQIDKITVVKMERIEEL